MPQREREERKEEHVRKEGKNMDRPPRPRLCFTHPEQNESEREREHEEEDQLRRELDRAEWEAGGRPSDTGDAAPQFWPKKPGRCTLLAH